MVTCFGPPTFWEPASPRDALESATLYRQGCRGKLAEVIRQPGGTWVVVCVVGSNNKGERFSDQLAARREAESAVNEAYDRRPLAA